MPKNEAKKTVTHQFSPDLTVRLARSPDDVVAAQRLRYAVFITEMGGSGPQVDHAGGREMDAYDRFADHLVLCDATRAPGDRVVGVYRLLSDHAAQKAGGFYTETEFDLTPLKRDGRRLLELGRTCLHPDYRGTDGMLRLWQGLAAYVAEGQFDLLFGTASFQGTDVGQIAAPLGLLFGDHLAPAALRPQSLQTPQPSVPPLPQINRKAAMRAIPALIKGYLRLGGRVGAGVFVDKPFNTTDVCLVLEAGALNKRQRAIYAGTAAHGC